MSRLRKALLALIFVFGLPGSGWAWSFVAASAVDTNAGGGSPSDTATATSVTVDVPTGTADNDVMFAICKYPNTETLTQASWTSLGTRNDPVGVIYNVLWRLASSEPATYAFTIGTGGRFGCSCYSFRGDFDTADPINEALLSNTAYTTNDTTIRAASVTTAEVNVPIVFFGVGHSSSAITQTTAPQVPAAFTEHNDVNDGGSDSRFFRSVSSLLWASSGATGDMDSVISASSTTKHGFAVVLNAADAAASGPPIGSLRLLGVGR